MEFEEGSGVDTGSIEDRRGSGGFGGRGLAIGGGGGVIGLIGLVLTLVLGGGGGGSGLGSTGLDQVAQPSANTDLAGRSCQAGSGGGRIDVFVACAFNDVQRTWEQLFAASGEQYRPATLVLYGGQTTTGCGVGSSAAGPFYCPADEKVYLDTTFFTELRNELGAGGDFAAAYVVAHEVAHHVQTVTGTSTAVRQAVQKKPSRENDLSVRQELQADCYAGVWANAAQKAGTIRLDATDVPEALAAAEAIGDDRLQSRAGRNVNPESFTHGTSEQRQRWLQRGLESGDPESCDTFSPKTP